MTNKSSFKKDLVAWIGEKYVIEWFFTDQGKSLALEYFENLSVARKKKLVSLFMTMASIGKIFNEEKFTSEGDQIFAFKPAPDRFLCFFFAGGKIIVTNAYEKKSQKMPRKEKERSLKYKEDYIKRVAEGTYYE